MVLRFTGERPIPGATPDLIFDGVKARYIHAKNLMETYSIDRVLDVGCATGIGSSFLAANGFSVSGIDIDAESINWGISSLSHPNLHLQEGRGEKLPFDNNAFDSVIAFECIEHMLSPYDFMLEVKRVLKPSGIFICSVPYCIGDVLAEMLYGSSNPYHVQRFSPQTMNHLLSKEFTILAGWGQRFHTFNHYNYLFLHHFVWRCLKQIPFLGRILLSWKNKKDMRIARIASSIDMENQLDYARWSEQTVPLEWKLHAFGADPNRIPETLIFLSRKL